MNNVTNKLGGLLTALFFICVLGIAPVVAHAQDHMTWEQVHDEYLMLTATHRSVPEPIMAGYLMAEGITWFDNGTYLVDGTPSAINYGIRVNTYDTVMCNTGDPIVAAEAAAGLLTPAELDEAMHGGMKNGNSYAYGVFRYLAGFPSCFMTYYSPGSGGGGVMQN